MSRSQFAGATPLPQPDASVPRGRLRICLVSFDVLGPVRNSGGATACTSLALALTGAGHEVTLLYGNGPRCERGTPESWRERYAALGIAFEPLPPSADSPIDATHYVERSHAAYDWLRRRKFDVVHFMDFGGLGHVSTRAKRQGLGFAETLLCVNVHGPYRWTAGAALLAFNGPQTLALDHLERGAIAAADVLVAPSRFLVDWMAVEGWSLPAAVHVQPNVLPDYARPAGPRDPGPRPVEEIVFFGRIQDVKGIAEFCDAVELLADGDAAAPRVTFLGKSGRVDGEDGATWLRRRTAGWRLPWSLVDDLDEPGALDYLRSGARLAVIPSRRENSPYVVLECIAAGVPLLAARRGGIPELIHPDDIESATVPLERGALAERLARAVRDGARVPRPAIDAAENERRWLRWHDGLAAARAAGRSRPTRASAPPATARDVSVLIRITGDGDALGRTRERLLADKSGAPGELILVEAHGAAGWNDAARRARRSLLALFDAGDLPEPGLIASLAKVASTCGAAVVVPSVVVGSGDRLRRRVWLDGPGPMTLLEGGPGRSGLLVDCAAFLELGGFADGADDDESAAELVLRATLAGMRVEALARPGVVSAAGSPDGPADRGPRSDRVLAPAIAAIPESLRDLVPLVVGLGRETRHQRRRAAGAEARRAEVDARAARLDEPLTRLLALVARLIDDGAVDGGIAALEIARDLLDAAGDGPRAADAATALREIRAALAPSSV